MADADSARAPLGSAVPAEGRDRGAAIEAVGVGLVAALLGGAGSWIPWPWPDEGATLSAVTRSFPQLLQLLTHHTDAVHGLYYLLAHVWSLVFGPTVPSIRALSAVAVGVGAAGVVVLGRQIGGRRFSITAGVVFALLPQTLWSATEARSYALYAATSVWMTVSLLQALRRGRRYWAQYAVVTAVGTSLFVFLLLVALAHLVTVALLTRSRRLFVLTGLAVTSAVALASPVLVLAVRQRGQVGWIRGANLVTPSNVFVYQWFGHSAVAATAGWLLVTCAVVSPLLLRGVRARMATVLMVGLPWLVVPTLLLVLTTLVKPLYVARYALVSSPALALLIAGALVLVRPRVAAVVVVIFAVAVVPEYVRQRQVEGKGYDWGSVSPRIAQVLEPTDAVYVHPDLPMTAYRVLYVDELRRYEDPAYDGSRSTEGGLWDSLAPASVAAGRVTSQRVALVEDNSEPGGADADLSAFRRAGFALTSTSKGYSTDIYVLERVAPAR